MLSRNFINIYLTKNFADRLSNRCIFLFTFAAEPCSVSSHDRPVPAHPQMATESVIKPEGQRVHRSAGKLETVARVGTRGTAVQIIMRCCLYKYRSLASTTLPANQTDFSL